VADEEETESEDDEDAPLVPPSADRVARRALALAAVAARGHAEQGVGDPEAEQLRARILEWVPLVGLGDELEPLETQTLEAPLGALTPQQGINASWRAEGLVVLAWALGRSPLPAYDDQCDGGEVAATLGFLDEASASVLAAPVLRPAEELAALCETLFSLHWRLRQFSLDGRAMDFADFARKAWFGPLSLEGLRLNELDLELGSLPLARAPEPQRRTALSIARERQQAANWLEGQEALYSEVTCDT
jgi:hypothetical protein